MPRVLLIEDDEDLRLALAGTLALSGYEVSEASEGEGALKAATDRNPDVVVTDIVMDGMEGISAIMALRARFGTVPIVAISGNPFYLRNSEKLGADAALLKPFRREVLLETIDKLLNG